MPSRKSSPSGWRAWVALALGLAAGWLAATHLASSPPPTEPPQCAPCLCPPSAPTERSPARPGKRKEGRARPLPAATDREQAQEALRRWARTQAQSLLSCASREGSRALLSLELDAKGHVRNASLLAREALPAQVERCVIERARTWQAPAPGPRALYVNLALGR